MPRKWIAATGFLGLLMFGTGFFPALAGDALSGKITEVKSAEILTLDYGQGTYVIRIVGVDAPKEGPLAKEAQQFVAKLVLGKTVRLRFENRNQNGEMVSRLFTGDPGIEIGVELLKAGLARRQEGYDYKYGELAAAENEARKARRGLWAATPQK